MGATTDAAILDTAAFARNGFGIVRRAVPVSLLATLDAAVRRVQDTVTILSPTLRERLTLERELGPERRGGIPAEAVGDAIFILGDPPAFDPVFRVVLNVPAVVAAFRAALGTSDLAAHFMNVTIKHPRFGRGIAWHRDFPNGYACPPSSCFARAMLCLDGMGGDGGATAFLPGSHHLDDDAARQDRRPPGWQPPDGTTVTLGCDPGDLVLIHPKVLHGGGMNTSATPRRNLIIQAGDAAVPLLQAPDAESVAGCRLGAA